MLYCFREVVDIAMHTGRKNVNVVMNAMDLVRQVQDLLPRHRVTLSFSILLNSFFCTREYKNDTMTHHILERLATFKTTFKPPSWTRSTGPIPNKHNVIDSVYIPVVAQRYINLIGDNVTLIKFENLTVVTSSPKRKFIYYCQLFWHFFAKETGTRVPLTIYYFPVPELGHKAISEHTPLGPVEINSGVTFHLHKAIVIYREEEATKVLIHELVHAFRLDEGVTATKPQTLTSSVPVRFTETFTELLAALLYTELNRGTMPRVAAISALYAHFNKQCDKVLCVYTTHMKQDTHVFEYIVAKYAMCQATSIPVLLNLFDNKREFSRVLDKAIKGYMDNFRCYLNSIP